MVGLFFASFFATQPRTPTLAQAGEASLVGGLHWPGFGSGKPFPSGKSEEAVIPAQAGARFLGSRLRGRDDKWLFRR